MSRSLLIFAMLLAMCCFIFGSLGNVSAQVWTSANGTHELEAEFVQLKDGKVQLRRAGNDKLMWIELKKLSEDDRKRAKALQIERESSPEGLLKSINVVVELSTGTPSNIISPLVLRRPPQKLKISLIARGKAATNAFRIGKLALTKLTDGEGRQPGDAKKTPAEFVRSYIRDDVFDIKWRQPENGTSNVHPRGGVFHWFKWPGQTFEENGKFISVPVPEKIGELSGHFYLHTGGTRTKIRIDRADWLAGEEIEHESFRDAGVTVKLMRLRRKKDSKRCEPRFQVGGDYRNLVSLYFGDEDGKTHEGVRGGGQSGTNEHRNYDTKFESAELPDDAFLWIETVVDRVDLKVPFEFKNLRVPSKPYQVVERK